MRSLPVLLSASVAALGLAACGGLAETSQTLPAGGQTATVSSSATSPGAGQGTASATQTGGDATSTTVPSTTTSAPATVTTETITAPNSGGAGLSGASGSSASAACVGADLRPAAVPPNSAPGTTVLGFTLTNASSRSCASGAFPGIGLVLGTGAVDDVTVTRSTHDSLGATPVQRIDLRPGQAMSFRLTLHDTGTGCASYTGVQIIAPNDTTPMRLTIPDGPVQSCGTVAVSALEPGSDATGQ